MPEIPSRFSPLKGEIACSREATKMIQTNHVNVGQQGTQTGNPPIHPIHQR